MKRVSLLLILGLLFTYDAVIGQTWPADPGGSRDCLIRGNIKVNGAHPPAGSSIAVLSANLTTRYQVFSHDGTDPTPPADFYYDSSADLTYFGGLSEGMPASEVSFVLVLWVPTPTPTFYIIDQNFISCNATFQYVTENGSFMNDDNATYDFTEGCPGNNLMAVSACLLPVEFLSFTARAEEQSVRLNWATSFEENNEFFTVERSFDGATFEALANVNGAGTTYEQQNYTWIDDSPLPGISYYRIKQTDFDGAFAYSDVASVKMNGTLGQTMRIFPNPAETSVRVSIPSVGQSGKAVLSIYNHIGQLVQQKEYSTEGQLMEFDTSKLPAGIYTLHVQQGVRNYSEKLVIK